LKKQQGRTIRRYTSYLSFRQAIHIGPITQVDEDHILVQKEGRIPGVVVSHDQISHAVVVDLLFSRGIMEEIHGNVWGVSEGPRPGPELYAQTHTVQHKPVENAVILP